MDPELTFLALQDDKNKTELLTTTPEHPFYLAENTDNSNRPKPIGHEELSNKWVGAGHLKAGDRLKKADGTLGTVVYVNTLAETRKMYNLEVQSAHTFFVGQNGWLTHNCSLPKFTQPG
ncbi:MAG: polymorphic toxin-type HINT domain-containing protein [Deinococcaceae bacterium]